jgi:type VI secretion system protein ImpC
MRDRRVSDVVMDVALGEEEKRAAPQPDTPFRIAILGDFSARASRRVCDKLASRRAMLVDRDNSDEVMRKLAVRLELPLGSAGQPNLSLAFSGLDDFHPDHIFASTAIFQTLRQMRDRLSNRETFAQVLTELGLGSAAPRGSEPATQGAQPPITSADVERLASGDLLAQAIEETHDPGAARKPSRAPDELRAFVERVVQPHLITKADPRQPEMVAALDRAASNQMRALLHVPDLQALESAWRALFFLVRRVETDEQLKVYLLDISKDELAADLAEAADLRSTGIYKLLVEQTVGTPGAEPWVVLAGNYTFEPTRTDAELLGRVAKVARAAGAPFLAAASSRLLGCESLVETPDPRNWEPRANSEDAEAWKALRGLPEASYVGLALPRFLLRLPYGKDTDPAELFDFEEMSQPPVHEDYLWGNPAFACTILLAQAFSQYGWEMRPGAYAEIDGLPIHPYQDDGYSQLKPCGEVLLTEDAVEQILDHGPMPLVSLKNRDAVRLVRFQSMADPPRALAGRWS